MAVTPKGAATRAFLLQVAAEVFAERGYVETTMAELIARSGLTKGAFYFHFSSKDQLALAVVDLTRLYLPGMLERDRGAIINVGSTAGFQPVPYMAVYGATKAFVLSFTEALWAETRGTG